jgi:hypothetical protein
MRTKVAALTVIGPRRPGSKFPNDLELHLFGRSLVEANNPNIDIEWFVAYRSSWNYTYPELSNTRCFPLSDSDLSDSPLSHSSLEHGLMLNYLVRLIPDSHRFVLIMDPDCFLVGSGGLAQHLEFMVENEVAVSGTPYGLTFPKASFRDFPTVFSMLLDQSRVNIKSLDFTPELKDVKDAASLDLDSENDFISRVRRRLRNAIRPIASRFLKLTLGIADPVLWWGFLMGLRNSQREPRFANDTSYKVRDTLRQTLKHHELKVVVSRLALFGKASVKVVATRKDSDPRFGTSEYFRNHGIFEGWKRTRGGVRDYLTELLVRVAGGPVPSAETRFPTSSLVLSEGVKEGAQIERLVLKYPGIDIWSDRNSIYAIHLGLPTKIMLGSSADWDRLRAEIETL